MVASCMFLLWAAVASAGDNAVPRQAEPVIDARPVPVADFVAYLNTLLPMEDGKVARPPARSGALGQLEPPDEIKRLVRVPSYWLGLGGDGFYLNGLDGSEPVFNVTWNGADAYCRAKGKVLPSEKKWAEACVGGGKDFIVSAKKEWTADSYQPGDSKRTTEAAGAAAVDARLRSVKGGADTRGKVNCSSRYGLKPETAVMNLTFRCMSYPVADRP